jgi:uncharacterized protein YigE (DUF2233 family)
MRRLGAAAGAALLLVAAAPAPAAGCAPMSFEGQHFTICEADPAQDSIRMWHRDADGTLYGGFRAVDRALGERGARLAFAMNAGMYHPDREPVGLYIEGGVERAPLITRARGGNFALLPNGVFCLGPEGARVIETQAFAAARPVCRFATQSGPLLVIGGDLHPRFLPDSDSRYVRNGVGVAADGRVLFAISEQPVTFFEFGRLFRDGLGVPDALYLDGSVSRLHAPALGRSDIGLPLGPIIGVAAPAG